MSYTDKNTSLVFSPDDKYIDTGVNYNISSSYVSQIVQGTYLTLRSFPIGNRNCYTLKPAMQNRRYLIRATFFYGNYDGKYATNDKFLFDLHMGVNFWRTVNISDASQAVEYEAIIVALADFVSVCLVNKGSGTPFISSLEMRPLKSSLYPTVTASSFFDLSLRRDFGGSKITRYPDDPYDRIWYPRCNMWTLVKTKLNVTTDGFYEVPNVVLQTAILPINSTNSTVPEAADPTLNISLYWPIDPSVRNPSYYANLHFAELQQLPPNGLREFNIFANGYLFADKVRPSYLLNEPYSSQSPFQNPNGSDDSHVITLTSTKNATVPPLINAIEVFNLLPVKTAMTNLSDVDAIMNIKAAYQVKKNWSGDPCAPVVYTWENLGCNYDSSSPRIVTL
ncbi:Leucine-rich repeat protein kinase family protein [Rhynchospora pubera]|uniref:Leucine-rich repeat protein kinase family protein n=1 Tax=Rhynchospora pubera TaxID=906938 RepID=A0AAV8C2M1_9POAL|nr:Leucine-rich repeat protein kinase family protein [Rhynchospora pubera]